MKLAFYSQKRSYSPSMLPLVVSILMVNLLFIGITDSIQAENMKSKTYNAYPTGLYLDECVQLYKAVNETGYEIRLLPQIALRHPSYNVIVDGLDFISKEIQDKLQSGERVFRRVDFHSKVSDNAGVPVGTISLLDIYTACKDLK